DTDLKQVVSCQFRRAFSRSHTALEVHLIGGSYDNALAEAFNSLFKAELIRNRHKGPWRDIDDLEIAVAEYIDWFNHRRIHGEIGYVPPAEYEAQRVAVEPTPEPVDDLIDAR
ncbi:UNVERIFIED_ORG: integrase-like protein, partial [Dietzia maris]|uniref:integrase core domain-containing protein n=1 Tax=Dietzia maris TaxID=37915 RepID=UPI0010E7270B